MKTYFVGDGYRETKTWHCSACKNYTVSGMDTLVDQHVARHRAECLAICKKTVMPYWNEATESTSETCNRTLPCVIHNAKINTAITSVTRVNSDDVTKNLNQIFHEASQRCELKELIWQIYQDPKKVEQAIEALKKI